MSGAVKFFNLLRECLENTLAVSNDENKLIAELCKYFDKIFGSYKLFIAEEYNYLYSVSAHKETDSQYLISPKKTCVPSLECSFLSENLKIKSRNAEDRDFYISTSLCKILLQNPFFRIGGSKSKKCPLNYGYLLCLKSKNTLLGMVNIDSFSDVFSTGNFISQINMLQSSVSGIFETFHLYRDFDIKINEFMKLKDSTEMIIESIDLGIIVIEYHNKLRAINKKALEMLGIDRGISDHELTSIINSRFNDNILEIVSYNLKTSESSIKLFDKEYRKDDHIKRIDMVICPYKDISNRLTGFIIIIDDITERKKYEEKLLRQEKLASLGQVIAGVAHEINTPLAGIRSYSQLLKESISNSDLQESGELTEKIIKQVDRCSIIMDELLSFARKKKANKTYFNLNTLIADVISITETIIKGKDITINIISEDHDRVIFGDRGKLEQVFLNLILNAKDAIDLMGCIDIAINDKYASTEIIVRDNGRGIPEEDITRIFDPFFTTKKISGTGLGLSLSYGVIKDHNGDIRVKSKLGEGTEFIVTLPKS